MNWKAEKQAKPESSNSDILRTTAAQDKDVIVTNEDNYKVEKHRQPF
ncbi:hypothetical protein [Neobacillus sp. SuZ13]|nr:hypothetical protein [Neobacillus sp. SuZ13]WHY67872.1 hypothetical protein QNH17_04270 [Neobacillus sp. SuZ13]